MHRHLSLAALALMAIVAFASAANACQLVCLPTGAQYDGNLGGWAGADAKCAAEYPGFKFARSSYVVNMLPNNGHPLSYQTKFWAGSGVNYTYNYTLGGYEYANNTCNNWTNNVANGTSTNAYGATAHLDINYGYWVSNYGYCNSVQQILCCNM